MRLRYSFTSDIKEVPEKVKFHLEHFNAKNLINKKFHQLIKCVSAEPLNFLEAHNIINEVRAELIKMDNLLEESANILHTFHQAETGQFKQPEKQLLTEEKEEKNTIKNEEEDPTVALNNAFNQLSNLTKNVANLGKTND